MSGVKINCELISITFEEYLILETFGVVAKNGFMHLRPLIRA
jgi:hypothetical protein